MDQIYSPKEQIEFENINCTGLSSSILELSIAESTIENAEASFSGQNTEESMLPDLVIEIEKSDNEIEKDPFENVESFTITGKEGRQARVLGLEAGENKTLRSLLKTLHPDLSRDELEKVHRQTLKYNKEFGNDLEGGRLERSDKVYLTSVRQLDEQGNISSIRRPDGSLTEFDYNNQGKLVAFKTLSHSGTLLESARQLDNGSWSSYPQELEKAPSNITVDKHGNLRIENKDGTSIEKLSNGTELKIKSGDNNTKEVKARHLNQEIFQVTYKEVGNAIEEKVTYFSDSHAPVVKIKLLDIEEIQELKEKFNPEQSIYNENDLPTREALKLAHQARDIASKMNTTGRCAEGVQLSLARAGYSQFLGCGHAWQMLEPLNQSHLFQPVDASLARPGDLMLRKSATGSYGHIAIITQRKQNGQLIEASDHESQVNMENPRYSKTVFLRLKS